VGDLNAIKQEHIHITAVSHYWRLFKIRWTLRLYDEYLPLTCMRRAASYTGVTWQMAAGRCAAAGCRRGQSIL